MYDLQLWHVLIVWIVSAAIALGFAALSFGFNPGDSIGQRRFKLAMCMISVIGGPISVVLYTGAIIMRILVDFVADVIELVTDGLRGYRGR